ncbi:MAG: hypothetical protein ABJE95_00275 [Byssovorax sp.]
MITVAQKNGFRDWKTIYDDPSNADFRATRPNPNNQMPFGNPHVGMELVSGPRALLSVRTRYRAP